MIERRHGARLAGEPFPELRVAGEIRGQDLQRQRAFEPCVARAVHLSHPARTDARDNDVGADSIACGEWHWWAGVDYIEDYPACRQLRRMLRFARATERQ